MVESSQDGDEDAEVLARPGRRGGRKSSVLSSEEEEGVGEAGDGDGGKEAEGVDGHDESDKENQSSQASSSARSSAPAPPPPPPLSGPRRGDKTARGKRGGARQEGRGAAGGGGGKGAHLRGGGGAGGGGGGPSPASNASKHRHRPAPALPPQREGSHEGGDDDENDGDDDDDNDEDGGQSDPRAIANRMLARGGGRGGHRGRGGGRGGARGGGAAGGGGGGAGAGNDGFARREELLLNKLHEKLPQSLIDSVTPCDLKIPRSYLKPRKMCAVNRSVQCIDPSDIEINRYAPLLAFVVSGDEAIPSQFQDVAWMMETINRAYEYTGFVVPTPNTRLTTINRGKKVHVTGVEARMRPMGMRVSAEQRQRDRELAAERGRAGRDDDGEEDDEEEMVEVQEDDSQSEDPPLVRVPARVVDVERRRFYRDLRVHNILSHEAYCNEQLLASGQDGACSSYVQVPMVRMFMRVHPIEYIQVEEDGTEEQVRKTASVLYVSPVDGFDLTGYINSILERKYLKSTDKQLTNWMTNFCELWARTLNFETSENLDMGTLDTPSADRVRSLSGPYSLASTLSYCNVGERIWNGTNAQVPKKSRIKAGTLSVQGFPSFGNPRLVSDFIRTMREKDRAYQRLIEAWHFKFRELRAGGPDEDGVAVQPFPELVPGLFADCRIAAQIDLSGCFELKVDDPRSMMGLVHPKVAVAVIGYYLSTANDGSDVMGRCTLDQYVETHVDDETGKMVATRNKVFETYQGVQNASKDLPRAGMYEHVRRTLRKTLEAARERLLRVVDEDGDIGPILTEMTDAYTHFVGMIIKSNERAMNMGVFGSMRVEQRSEIIGRLAKNDLPGRVLSSIQFCLDRVHASVRAVRQRYYHSEEMMALNDFIVALCVLNETALMNAINISTLTHMLVSDVLFNLGSDNKTWVWKMFTLWVAGGCGHLCIKEGISSDKINSSGLSNVVIKMVNFCLESMASLVDFGGGGVKLCLSIDMLSKITAPQIHCLCASTYVGSNPHPLKIPDKTRFLRLLGLDEVNRQLPPGALDALVVRIPRDRIGGGSTVVTCEPEAGKPMRESGVVVQERSMNPGVIAMASNALALKPEEQESIKSILTAIHVAMPGAAPTDGKRLMDMLAGGVGGGGGGGGGASSSASGSGGGGGDGGGGSSGKRKKMTEVGQEQAEGVCMEPEDPEVRSALAYILSAMPGVSGWLGLMNKTGMTQYEVDPCVMWLFNHIVSLFSRFLPFMLGSRFQADFHRLMEGYMSHGVALCKLTTVMKHFRRPRARFMDACVHSVLDMESGALTLQLMHTSLITGLARMMDTNLLWANQVMAAILDTPMLDLDWLVATLCGRRYKMPREGICKDERTPSVGFHLDAPCESPDVAHNIDRSDPNAQLLIAFLHRVMHLIRGEFVEVQGAMEYNTYMRIQPYLSRFVGLPKNRFPTYQLMFSECSAKTIDLITLLNSDAVSLRNLCASMGVPYSGEEAIGDDQQSRACLMDRGSFVLLSADGRTFGNTMADAGGGGGGGGGAQAGGGGGGGGGRGDGGSGLSKIKRVLVNVVHLLFIRALQGDVHGRPVELHSDNSQEMVFNLYPWFLRRFVPLQAVPVGVIQPLAFRHAAHGVYSPAVLVNAGKVFESHTQCANCFRDYVIRPLSANGVRFYRDYWWEDVCHMGSYIQTWQLIVQLSQPRDLMSLPKLSPRVPDLVPGRVYPMRTIEGRRGVVCVYPRGMRFVLMGVHRPDEGETSWWALEPEAYQSVLEDNRIVVGPLIHRGNAAIRLGPADSDNTLDRVGVILPRADGRDFEGIDFESAADWVPEFGQIAYPVDMRYFFSARADDGYLFTDGEEEAVISEEHVEPILIGTTVYVKTADAREALGTERVPLNFSSPYVMFKLRYPDECASEPAENDKVYVVVDSPEGACVYGFSPEACFVDSILSSSSSSVSASQPAVVDPQPQGGGAGGDAAAAAAPAVEEVGDGRGSAPAEEGEDQEDVGAEEGEEGEEGPTEAELDAAADHPYVDDA